MGVILYTSSLPQITDQAIPKSCLMNKTYLCVIILRRHSLFRNDQEDLHWNGNTPPDDQRHDHAGWRQSSKDSRWP